MVSNNKELHYNLNCNILLDNILCHGGEDSVTSSAQKIWWRSASTEIHRYFSPNINKTRLVIYHDAKIDRIRFNGFVE